MAITDNSKIVILPEDFQEKRSNIPGAQILTIGELRNLFVKPFNWNAAYADALLTSVDLMVEYHNTFGNFINANFVDVNGSIIDDPQLGGLSIYNNFSGATFGGTIPSGLSAYSYCILDRASFDSCNLSGNASFVNCSMVSTIFSGANMGNTVDKVSFENCDLTNAVLTGIVFDPYVTFTGCKMDGINLNGSSIDQTGANGPNYFIDCTGLPDSPVGMGFTFGTGFLYWPATATYFNESFEELFCKTQVVDGVKFAGQNLVNKAFGFYNAGVVEPTSLRNCDFNNTTINMALNPGYVLFDNCNFQGSLGLIGTPADNFVEGENDGSIIRWIDGKLYSWSTGTSSWTMQ